MTEDTGIAQPAPSAATAAEYASSLRALLDVTRAVRSGAELGSVPSTIARAVGDPVDGRRPRDQKLAVAVARAAHAALALETAQERERLERHQTGLEQLLSVSSQLPQTVSTEEMLTSVCKAVREALGFEKVWIQLVDSETN